MQQSAAVIAVTLELAGRGAGKISSHHDALAVSVPRARLSPCPARSDLLVTALVTAPTETPLFPAPASG